MVGRTALGGTTTLQRTTAGGLYTTAPKDTFRFLNIAKMLVAFNKMRCAGKSNFSGFRVFTIRATVTKNTLYNLSSSVELTEAVFRFYL